MRTVKIYFLSNYQTCNTVLLTIHYTVHYIPMIYVFYIWKVVPFDHLHPISLSLASGNCQSVLYINELVGFLFGGRVIVVLFLRLHTK